MTRAAKTVNNAVVGANLHLLFPLSLLPFTAGWMGKNQFARLRTCLYGVNRLVVALPYCLQQLCSVWLHGPDSMLDEAIGRDAKGKGSLIFNLRGMAGDWFASPKPGLAFRRSRWRNRYGQCESWRQVLGAWTRQP